MALAPVTDQCMPARLSPDGMFAASLDDAGGDAQAAGPERGIAHALTVADEIVDAFAGLVAGWGVLGEGGDEGADAAGIEFVTSLFRPLRGEFGPGCVDGLGDVPEVAFGVEDVDDLDRIGETLVGEGPDQMLCATFDLDGGGGGGGGGDHRAGQADRVRPSWVAVFVRQRRPLGSSLCEAMRRPKQLTPNTGPERRVVHARIDEFSLPSGGRVSARPDLAAVDALLLVVDTVNMRPGTSGVLTVGAVRVESRPVDCPPFPQGAGRSGQVRTVSRK